LCKIHGGFLLVCFIDVGLTLMSTARHFAEKLLQINALQVNIQNPYTWASGWRSPVYCDNRKVLSYPYTRDFVKSELANMVLEHFPDADAVAGVATAGIAIGVLAADLLKLPFLYVRSKPKEHGMGNVIEGVLEPGQKVVVIEDLVSTGKSSLQVVNSLREAGAEVLGMCALFTYGFPEAEAAFDAAHLPLKSISNYSALIELAIEKGMVAPAELDLLQAWRANPAEWMQTSA
jgi:orotate phosphoribosyltransferase